MNYQVDIKAIQDYILWLHLMQYERQLDQMLTGLQQANKELKEITNPNY